MVSVHVLGQDEIQHQCNCENDRNHVLRKDGLYRQGEAAPDPRFGGGRKAYRHRKGNRRNQLVPHAKPGLCNHLHPGNKNLAQHHQQYSSDHRLGHSSEEAADRREEAGDNHDDTAHSRHISVYHFCHDGETDIFGIGGNGCSSENAAES